MLEPDIREVLGDRYHRVLIPERAPEDDVVVVVGVLSEDALGVLRRNSLGVVGLDPVELLGRRLAALVVGPRPPEVADLRVVHPGRSDGVHPAVVAISTAAVATVAPITAAVAAITAITAAVAAITAVAAVAAVAAITAAVAATPGETDHASSTDRSDYVTS